MIRKVCIFVILVFFVGLKTAQGIIPLQVIDTPTAGTLLRGSYHVYFSSYEEGGVKLKIAVGLSDCITFGLSEDVGAAIGNEKSVWTWPMGLLRLGIWNWEDRGVGLAAGFGNLMEGEYGKIDMVRTNGSGIIRTNREVEYGLYAVSTLPTSLFGQTQLFSFGTRFNLFPVMDRNFSDLTFFCSYELPLSKNLKFKAELENFNLVQNDAIMLNGALTYTAGDVLGVSLNFRYLTSKKFNLTGLPSRSITIEYQNLFF